MIDCDIGRIKFNPYGTLTGVFCRDGVHADKAAKGKAGPDCHAAIPHSRECACSRRNILVCDAWVSGHHQKDVAKAFGPSRSRIPFLIKQVLRCKSKAVGECSIRNALPLSKTDARYLMECAKAISGFIAQNDSEKSQESRENTSL